MRRPRLVSSAPSALRLTLAAAVATAVLAGAPATAQAGFATGLGDPIFFRGDAGQRAFWLERSKAAGARYARLILRWNLVATGARPSNPRDPADPAYRFGGYDTVIREMIAHGLRPILTIAAAPPWAEGPGRPANAVAGTWMPQPAELAAFGEAVARRYSGNFAGLPRVRDFQLWNEQNQDESLSPQWRGRKAIAPVHYRKMLNAFYGAVKSVNRKNVVVAGGTSPYGDPRGGPRMRPLAFWRKALCLKKTKVKLRAAKCKPKARFDVLAHNALSTIGPPRRSASHPDDIGPPDVGDLRQTLRAAERKRRAGGRRRHPIWVTEFWWEVTPKYPFPDGIPPNVQARYMAETLFLYWEQGVKVAINLLVRDTPPDEVERLGLIHAGLYNPDGSAKPVMRAFRFPFVTERRSKRRLFAWGLAPAKGKLVIERRRGSDWRRVASLKARRGKVFTRRLAISGKATLRARVAGQTSIPWAQRR